MYMYTEGSGRGFYKNQLQTGAQNQTYMRVSVRTAGWQGAGGGMLFVRRAYKSYTVSNAPGIWAWFYGGAESSTTYEISDPGGIFSGGWSGTTQYFTTRDVHSYYATFDFNGGGSSTDTIYGEYYHQRAFSAGLYGTYTWDASNGGAGDGAESLGGTGIFIGW